MAQFRALESIHHCKSEVYLFDYESRPRVDMPPYSYLTVRNATEEILLFSIRKSIWISVEKVLRTEHLVYRDMPLAFAFKTVTMVGIGTFFLKTSVTCVRENVLFSWILLVFLFLSWSNLLCDSARVVSCFHALYFDYVDVQGMTSEYGNRYTINNCM